MSAVDDRTMTAGDVLAAVQALAPSISSRAAEIEAARRLPPRPRRRARRTPVPSG